MTTHDPGPFTYRWARPALTVDVTVFGLMESRLAVLLVQRGLEPFAGWWALPGGFVEMAEGLEDAARRELAEEADVRPASMEQIGAFGTPDRDPRDRVVSVAFWALVRPDKHRPTAGTDASAAAWHPIERLPPLAFDHSEILDAGLGRLRARAWSDGVGAELLDEPFTLAELQTAYEALFQKPLDKRNFRRRMLELGVLRDTGAQRLAGRHRPAQLYQLDRARVAARGPSLDLL